MTNNANQGVLTPARLKKYRNCFLQDPALRLAMNAVTRGNLQEIALNRQALNTLDFRFSHEIETKAAVTDQKRAGTCWLFAELNWLRTITQSKFQIEDLEFSQNYLIFWDKLEKANYFLEQMIQLRDRDLDDRKVHFLLHRPLPDGGEWHMLVNLIKKYGLLPKAAMKDTFHRENSRFVNERIGYKLREAAALLRKMNASGKTLRQLYNKKNKIMEEIYRMLVVFYGMPPDKFDWGFRDKDKKYHQERQITPHHFYEKYVGLDLDEVYSLASCPTESTEFYKTYCVEFFQNMTGGVDWKWLNLPIKELKKIAVRMLKNKEACLYGCDVLQESHTKEGLMHHKLYDYELVFQTSFNMDKATRLDYGQSVLTHSMVLIGVELVDDKPVRWKVENSWGSDYGKKGYYIMSDEWFDEHVLDLIVPKKYLGKRLLKLFEQEPILLPPWHYMR